jgi:hypothetical protein
MTERVNLVPSFLIPFAVLLTALLPEVEPTAPRRDSIRQQDMKADLFFLAGDGFRVRLTGTLENALASEFIASRFERLGLKRVGTGRSYFHHFQLSTAPLGPCNSLSLRLKTSEPSAKLLFHPGKMERIVRLVHQASWDLAQQASRPSLENRSSRNTAARNREP